MVLTVVHSLTLLLLISVFAVAVNGGCCVGNCKTCNNTCTKCCMVKNSSEISCCLQACVSPVQLCVGNCFRCGNNCRNCCITEVCCTEVNSCLQTCVSPGNSSSSTSSFTSTAPMRSTGNSMTSTFTSSLSSTATTRSTSNSSSSTFQSSFTSTTTKRSTRKSSSSTFTSTTTTPSTDAEQTSSPVVAAVVSCLGALCVLVALVVGMFLLRREQQSQGVRTENIFCCVAAANPEERQNSLHIYDELSREHTRADNDKEPENTPDKTSKDDEYTYIDDATIIKGTGTVHEDHQPATTATEQPTNINPFVSDPLTSSGLQPDLSSPYRLARAVNNDFPDSQTPDYFVLEERGEKNSAADTDTQQYFILEERQEGGERESTPQLMSPRSDTDYFVLEKPDDRESDCAGLARYDESREQPEDAEYSRLDPNGLEQSEYTLLNSTAEGDNPYSLASSAE